MDRYTVNTDPTFEQLFERIQNRVKNSKQKRRPEADKTTATFSISAQLADLFDRQVAVDGTNKSAVIEAAIEDYLNCRRDFPGSELLPKDELLTLLVISHFGLLRNMDRHLSTVTDLVFATVLNEELPENSRVRGLVEMTKVLERARTCIHDVAHRLAELPTHEYVLGHAAKYAEGLDMPNPFTMLEETEAAVYGLIQRSLARHSETGSEVSPSSGESSA